MVDVGSIIKENEYSSLNMFTLGRFGHKVRASHTGSYARGPDFFII